MNIDAMPHTLFIILVELAVGSLIIVLGVDARGLVTKGFVRLSAVSIWVAAGLAWWLSLTLPSGDDIDGYPLDGSALSAVRWTAFLLFAAAAPYVLLTFTGPRRASFVWGSVAIASGLALLLTTAQFVSPPTWGYAIVAVSLIAGAFAVGGVSTAMVLGHWYLVTPRLPSRPLNIVTFGLMVALLAQGLLMIISLILPVREIPASHTDLGLGEHPAFWLRVLGLLLPLGLAGMAWQASRERAMNAATGLLYLAMGAVLGGELMARGILFISARAV